MANNRSASQKETRKKTQARKTSTLEQPAAQTVAPTVVDNTKEAEAELTVADSQINPSAEPSKRLTIYQVTLSIGVAGLGVFLVTLDAIANAFSVVTPLITYIGTFLVIGVVITVIVLKRMHAARSEEAQNSEFNWGRKQTLSVLGILGLLWIPRVIPSETQGNLDIDMTVLTENSSAVGMPQESLHLSYGYTRSNLDLIVYPKMDYLSKIGYLSDYLYNVGVIPQSESQREKNGPVQGYGWYGDVGFDWCLPQISVKAVNNGNDTVLISESVVKVKTAILNTDPVLTFDDNTLDLTIYNEGWGEALNPTLRFGLKEFYDNWEALQSELNTPDMPDVRPYVVQLPNIDDTTTVDLSKYIPKHYREGGEQQIRYFYLFGELTYTTRNGKQKTLQIKTQVNFEGGAELDVSDKVYDLQLQAGRSGYEERIPINQYIKTKDPTHFPIRIISDKSAHYELEFSFRSAAGIEIGRRSVAIDIFIPRRDDKNKGRPAPGLGKYPPSLPEEEELRNGGHTLTDDEAAEILKDHDQQKNLQSPASGNAEVPRKPSAAPGHSNLSTQDKVGELLTSKGMEIAAKSSTQLLAPADLAQLASKDLAVIRNEIYARNGYRCISATLRAYFAQKGYLAVTNDDLAVYNRMSTKEKKNAATIKKYEDSHGKHYRFTDNK